MPLNMCDYHLFSNRKMQFHTEILTSIRNTIPFTSMDVVAYKYMKIYKYKNINEIFSLYPRYDNSYAIYDVISRGIIIETSAINTIVDRCDRKLIKFFIDNYLSGKLNLNISYPVMFDKLLLTKFLFNFISMESFRDNLGVAIRYSCLRMIKFLTRKFLKIYFIDSEYVLMAISCSKDNVVKYLLKKHPEVNSDMIFAAINDGSLKNLKRLMKKYMMSRDDYLMALETSLHTKSLDIINFLLYKNNFKLSNEEIDMYLYKYRNQAKIIKILTAYKELREYRFVLFIKMIISLVRILYNYLLIKMNIENN